MTAYATNRQGERIPLARSDEDEIYRKILTGESSRAVAAWFNDGRRGSISHTTVLKIARRHRAQQIEEETLVDRPELEGKSDAEQLDDAIVRLRRLQLRARRAGTRADYYATHLSLRALDLEIRTLRYKLDAAARERARLSKRPPMETRTTVFPAAVSTQKTPEIHVDME